MAQLRTSTGGGAGIQITLSANEDLLVADGVQVYSDNNYVVSANGGNTIVLSPNSGLISFASGAIRLGGSVDPIGNNEIIIGQNATVVGQILTYGSSSEISNFGQMHASNTGADMRDVNNSFTNHGDVTGESIGIRVWRNAEITNFGTVAGGAFGLVTREGGGTVYNSGQVTAREAVYLGGIFSERAVSRLNNTGEILGEQYGVRSVSESSIIVNSGTISSTFSDLATIYQSLVPLDGVYTLMNSGEIVSAGLAYRNNSGVDEITNTGLIVGDVEFGTGDDRYVGRNGTIEGEVFGGSGEDAMIGGAEANAFFGGDDVDRLFGGAGDDTLSGDDGQDVIFGNADNDEIYAGEGNDVVNGGDGDDEIYGGGGLDNIRGGDGNDFIDAGRLPDIVRGGNGDDVIFGVGSADQLYGGNGNDTIDGGNSNDTIYGGSGDDTLSGGAGNDVFVFNRKNGDDLITDFDDNLDRLYLGAIDIDTLAEFNAIATDTENGLLVDFSLAGGTGSVLLTDIVESQLSLLEISFL